MEGARAPEVIGRYAIYGKIASGGMASVHFGRLIGGAGFSRTVAIKRLHPHLAEDPEILSTIIDEARLAARIHHPNVVATLDVVSTARDLLLVMEYIRGEALSRLLRAEAARGKRAPIPIVAAIVVGALQGLDAAHEAKSDHGVPLGIVHRDVSPQNIVVGVDGLARVIDFGIAKAAGRLQETREGTVKGKMAYMAPEQLSGGAVTRATDVYAMGVVLWEALAGRRLFQADNDAALAILVINGPTQPPSSFAEGVPAALDSIAMRALAPVSRRYATAREMAEAITAVIQPALSTEVGAWCLDVARESIEQRGQALAEIESAGSGIENLVAKAAREPEPLPPGAEVPRAAPQHSDETRIDRVVVDRASSPTGGGTPVPGTPSGSFRTPPKSDQTPSGLRNPLPSSLRTAQAPISSPSSSGLRAAGPLSASRPGDASSAAVPSASRLEPVFTARAAANPLADTQQSRGAAGPEGRRPLAETVTERLAHFLGPHTARVAVKTFAQKALGRGAETLTLADLPALQAALRPMLRTFVGKQRTESILNEIARDCGA
jgi:serine/threonine-protein kinase